MTQKNEICDHFLGKNKIFEIFASILTRFFFSKFKIFKIFFIQPPKFIPYTNFKHQKWKLQGGFIIVPLPYWTGRASKQAASWFLPPLVFLGLTLLDPTLFFTLIPRGGVKNHPPCKMMFCYRKAPFLILWWIFV